MGLTHCYKTAAFLHLHVYTDGVTVNVALSVGYSWGIKICHFSPIYGCVTDTVQPMNMVTIYYRYMHFCQVLFQKVYAFFARH